MSILCVRRDFIPDQIILGNCQALRRYLSASLHKPKPFPVEFKGVSFYKHKGTTSRESDKINISPNDKLFLHVSIIFTQPWIHNLKCFIRLSYTHLIYFRIHIYIKMSYFAFVEYHKLQ